MSRCMECQRNGVESQSFPGATCSGRPTLVFYDDSGHLHQHSAVSETAYCCDKGHEWHERTYDPCPICGDDWRIEDGD